MWALPGEGAFLAPLFADNPEYNQERNLVEGDNATSRTVLKVIMQGTGHQVTMVTGTEQALERLAEEDHEPPVTTNMQRPLLDGRSVYCESQFANAVGGTPIPFVRLNATVISDTQRPCGKAGVAAYCTQPFDSMLLPQAINPPKLRAAQAAERHKSSAETAGR